MIFLNEIFKIRRRKINFQIYIYNIINVKRIENILILTAMKKKIFFYFSLISIIICKVLNLKTKHKFSTIAILCYTFNED